MPFKVFLNILQTFCLTYPTFRIADTIINKYYRFITIPNDDIVSGAETSFNRYLRLEKKK